MNHEAITALLSVIADGTQELVRLERLRDEAIGAYDRQERKVRLLTEGVDVLEKALEEAAQKGELEFPELIETKDQMKLPWPVGTKAVDSQGENVGFYEGYWRYGEKKSPLTGNYLPYTNVTLGEFSA